MKKQMRIIMFIIVVGVMLITLIPSVYAVGTTNFSVLLTGPKTAKRGETVEVTVNLDEFTGIGKGINSFMGELEYDKTKLSIESSNIIAQNRWDTPTYENDKILTLKGSMVTEKETIMKMTFTVNADAEYGTTTIKIKNVEASNDENDFVGADGTITLEIVKETIPPTTDGGNGAGENPPVDNGNGDGENPPVDNGNGDGENPPVDNGNGDGGNPPVDNGNGDGGNPPVDNPKEDNKDNTTADKGYNKAGQGITIVLAILIIAIIAIILYRKNKQYNSII